MRLETLGSIFEVDRELWTGLVAGAPFAGWDWLASLEASGVASSRNDWRPSHALLWDGATAVAACPLYVRDEERLPDGEFVWDGSVLRACRSTGRPYAPRAVLGVPWTPVSGRRLHVAPGAPDGLRATFAEHLIALAAQSGWASLNVQFCTPDDAACLEEAGALVRLGWQYHWHQRSYGSFDEFLARLKSSRRSSMRRELRVLRDQGVTVEFRPGDDADFRRMGVLYTDTARRHGSTEEQLTPRFFDELGQRMRDRVLFAVASRDSEPLAMTLNVLDAGVLYGRFWGCSEELPFLHFNVGYHRAIEHCIEAGIARFDPGHGGEYKRLRGFDPVFAHSAHWFADPALHRAVLGWAEGEAAWVRERVQEERSRGPLAAAED